MADKTEWALGKRERGGLKLAAWCVADVGARA